MRDKVGNYIRVFYVTCQWKAEVPLEGKLDRELKLQAVLSKTKEQLALSCIWNTRGFGRELGPWWQQDLLFITRGQMGAGENGQFFFFPCPWASRRAHHSSFAFSISWRGYVWAVIEGASPSCVFQPSLPRLPWLHNHCSWHGWEAGPEKQLGRKPSHLKGMREKIRPFLSPA